MDAVLPQAVSDILRQIRWVDREIHSRLEFVFLCP